MSYHCAEHLKLIDDCMSTIIGKYFFLKKKKSFFKKKILLLLISEIIYLPLKFGEKVSTALKPLKERQEKNKEM